MVLAEQEDWFLEDVEEKKVKKRNIVKKEKNKKKYCWHCQRTFNTGKEYIEHKKNCKPKPEVIEKVSFNRYDVGERKTVFNGSGGWLLFWLM